ncbi:MAG: FAD-dependent oxidoreductase, partial [Bdellovibrionales bacterium]|nr:FAD-dependent oxidoreductase [Bdellovibrionales bacterium]
MAKAHDLTKKHFIIIGGGLMGLSSAKSLLEKGAKVTVLEMNTVGKGCSFGNAGWLTPCFALPLPQPGLFWSSVKWLLNPESPLYIQPRMSLTLMNWLYRFLKAMNYDHLTNSTESLVQLSNLTLDLITKMNLPGSADFRKNGLLMVSATEKGLQSTLDEMNLVSRYGVKGSQLSVSQIQKMEPSLIGPLSGG